MPPYRLLCYTPGCGQPAQYKIAARWSDGVTEELKTYSLTCADCLPAWLRRSCEKQRTCRRARGETLEPPGVYELERGQRDRQLVRRPELEAILPEPPRSTSTGADAPGSPEP